MSHAGSVTQRVADVSKPQKAQGVTLSLKDELEYSAAMLRGLLEMAQARRDQIRSYFLQMAYIETCDRLRKAHEDSKTQMAEVYRKVLEAA